MPDGTLAEQNVTLVHAVGGRSVGILPPNPTSPIRGGRSERLAPVEIPSMHFIMITAQSANLMKENADKERSE
jgi:hypothetical protein